MGVADNQSYKDQYHFTDDKKDTAKDLPSVEKEPKINTIIKSNPYRSNVEIEGDEIVLQPDLTALFKAVGKKHNKGGMDVLLKPNSFLFSAFDGLAIEDEERELFELKDGGKFSKNTPADVLKKNVDIKHYNNLVNIISDPFKDDLAKKTAGRMLEKYIATLGNIAYIQENKKGFPTGIPEFAMGTAPVYNPELKDEIMANKQYMKAGGPVGNPYMQSAGQFNPYQQAQAQYEAKKAAEAKKKAEQDALRKQIEAIYMPKPATSTAPAVSTPQNSVITPPPQNDATAKMAAANPPTWGLWKGDKMPTFQNIYGLSNAADKFGWADKWDDVAQSLGYTGPKNNREFQKWLYNSSPENKAVVDKWHQKYNQGPREGVFDSKIGIRWANAVNEILTNKNKAPLYKPPVTTAELLKEVGKTAPKTPVVPGPEVPNLEVTPQGVKRADWQFTPWQKLSQAYNWGQYANVKRYMPYRSRYTATYADPALVNPEQAVGDMKNAYSQQLASIGALSPILRNAQAQSSFGEVLSQIPGVRTQYDNQNAQILNQFRQYNNQVKNNESLVNMANDQTYYTQAVEARKNFDNMKQYTANNAMNNLLGDVTTNQKLAYNLLTQNNPAYAMDWRSGDFVRTNKSIMDVQSSTINDRYSALVEAVNAISDPTEKAKLLVKIEGIKAFGAARNEDNPFAMKKGGKMRKNPYRK